MAEITQNLLDWYDANRRILPWREDPSPYHVWLSEIMLQQTRVEAVIGYYQRFLKVLPDIASLAAADEDTCLKLWEGLGYYSRVRHLHAAAVLVMEQYHGQLPSTQKELMKLPGIGAYTSAAIASIAFGEPVPAIDGNFLRVFARLTSYQDNIRSDEARKAATAFFTDTISVDRPGDFNQAVMDLGAMVCLPGGMPLCASCPLRTVCRIHQEQPGQEDTLPVMPAKKTRPITELTVFLIHLIRSGSASPVPCVLIRKRPDKGLLSGLYEFPNTEGFLAAHDAADFLAAFGIPEEAIRSMKKLPPARHVFTHREWQMQGYEIWLSPAFTPYQVPAGTASGQPAATGGADITNASSQTGNLSAALIPASLEELKHRYSIPSAFAAYESVLFREDS